MSPKTPCPADNTIDVLVRGELPAADWSKLENHFDECQRCRRAALAKLGELMTPTESLRASMPRLADRGPRDSREELQAGVQVGRHIIIERLGAGGMGTVYSAYDTILERRIALKFLSGAHTNASAAAKLLAEASAMARLSHPNVVTVHDVGMLEGRPYLAMEYVKGKTLREWREERPRSVPEILGVMAAAARGLEAAHAAGIIHRDVKPENILVSGARVLVTDFGVSVRDDAGSAGGVAGTPAYMAPEQLRGEQPTPATDVFGFAVTLYELLYEQRLFDGSSPAELESAIATTRVVLPRRRVRVSGHVERLILAGLAPDPAARPASMATVADALLSDPARRARRVGVAAVATVAVTAAFWGGARVEADPERRCLAAAGVMDATWSGVPRQELRPRFQAAGAAATWGVAERRFQEYRDGWRRTYAETCSAAFADRRISGELFDLRMHCLDGHRATFAALVGSLKDATPAQLSQLVGTPLPPVSDCALSERPATKLLPANPAARHRISEITAAVAEANAKLVTGDFSGARRVATHAVDAARKGGYEPLLARALAQLAAIEVRGAKVEGSPAGDGKEPTPSTGPDRAVKLLEQAIRVAEIGRADAERAAAAHALALAHRDAGRLTEAEEWVELASSIITRIGNPPVHRAAVHFVRGWIKYDRADWKTAGTEFDQSLRLQRQALGPRASELVPGMTNRCHVMGDRQGRIRCYREAAALAIEVVGPRHPDVANIKANIGHVLREDARTHSEGCTLLAEAVELQKSALELNNRRVLFSTNLLAKCLQEQGKIEEARNLYEGAIARANAPSGARGDLYQAYGVFLVVQRDFTGAARSLRAAIADRTTVYGATHFMAIESRYNLADGLRRQGRLVEALEEADKGIAVCESAGATPVSYPGLYEVKGTILRDMGRLEAGYQALRSGLDLHEKLNTPEAGRYFTVYYLALIEKKTGRLDQAVQHLEKALAMRPFEVAPDRASYVAFELADALQRRGRGERVRACTLARRALAVFHTSSHGAPDRPAIAVTRRWLAAHRCPAPPVN